MSILPRSPNPPNCSACLLAGCFSLHWITTITTTTSSINHADRDSNIKIQLLRSTNKQQAYTRCVHARTCLRMRVSEIVLSPCCFAFVSFLLSFKESVYVLSPWEKDMVLHLQEFLFYLIYLFVFIFIFFGVFFFLAVKIS